MKCKVEKKFLVFKTIAFEFVAGISPYFDENSFGLVKTLTSEMLPEKLSFRHLSSNLFRSE